MSPPEHSFQDLSNRRTAIASELEARIYMYNQRLLVSSVAAIAEYTKSGNGFPSLGSQPGLRG